MKAFFRKAAGYFLQGLVFITPIGVTLFVVIWFVGLFDDIFFRIAKDYLPWHIPGLGLLILLAGLTVLGYVIANLISISAMGWFDRLMQKAPLIKVVYFSVKDMVNVFFGKKHRLGQPVKVLVQRDPLQYKLGFITRSDMSAFGIGREMVSVYLPFSFGLMGNQMVVRQCDVEVLDVPAAELMKFILSGGAVYSGDDAPDSKAEDQP